MKHVRIELPVLLPEIPDARDACVRRLQELLSQRRGIAITHLVERAGEFLLCLHYEPDTITLDNVEQLARAAGAEVQERYGHQVLSIRAIAAEDAGRRIEETLMTVDGVLAASANLAAQSVRIEFERPRFRLEAAHHALRSAGFDAVCEPGRARSWYGRNRELAWSLAAGTLLSAAFVLAWSGADSWLVVPLYLGSYGFGAFDLVRHALSGVPS